MEAEDQVNYFYPSGNEFYSPNMENSSTSPEANFETYETPIQVIPFTTLDRNYCHGCGVVWYDAKHHYQCGHFVCERCVQRESSCKRCNFMEIDAGDCFRHHLPLDRLCMNCWVPLCTECLTCGHRGSYRKQCDIISMKEVTINMYIEKTHMTRKEILDAIDYCYELLSDFQEKLQVFSSLCSSDPESINLQSEVSHINDEIQEAHNLIKELIDWSCVLQKKTKTDFVRFFNLLEFDANKIQIDNLIRGYTIFKTRTELYRASWNLRLQWYDNTE